MIDSDYDDGCGGSGGGKGKLKRLKAICRHRRLHLSFALPLFPPLCSEICIDLSERQSEGLGPDELSGRARGGGTEGPLARRGENDC